MNKKWQIVVTFVFTLCCCFLCCYALWFNFYHLGNVKSLLYLFLLLFLSRLPRRQGSVLYCTTGIILQWLRSDPWVSLVITCSPSFSSAVHFCPSCPSSTLLVLLCHLLLSPRFVVDSAVCGRSISMSPHTRRQRNKHTHTDAQSFCWLIPECSSLHSEWLQKNHRDTVTMLTFLALFHSFLESVRLEWVILVVWQSAAAFWR